MTAVYTVRPISDRSAFTGPAEKGSISPFVAKWSATEQLLGRELDHLGAEHVVLEMDVRERDIRIDGRIRADARPATPAVRIAFDTPAGPMQFATDRFGWSSRHPRVMYTNGWQENVRAIALGMESLRTVDRYGITQAREQYRGFLQLTSGTVASGMSVATAMEVLSRETNGNGASTPGGLEVLIRAARINAHPDRHHGDHSRINAVTDAEQTLRKAGRL